MKDRLLTILQTGETKSLANIFKGYMEMMGVRKSDGRRKDNSNTYLVCGDDTNWNRVTCYYHKDSEKYLEEDLQIVLRKRAGFYIIIGRKGKRAFEADYNGVIHYDEELLKEIMVDHKQLFDALVAK